MTRKATIDLSPAGRQRREAEADNRMSASAATGPVRSAERRNAIAQIEREEAAEAQAAADHAEAAAERARVASVVRLGRDAGRGRQALRAALLAPLTAEAARGLIAAMPHDAAANEAALTVPGLTSFGTPAAEAERRRITSIFSHPAAAGRFNATVALALEGKETLTAAQISPVLLGLPLEAAPVDPLARLAQMAEARAEFGPSDAPVQSKGEAARDGWKRAATAANASIGAGSAVSAGGPTILDLAGPGEPGFGSQADLDRALAAARMGGRP